MQNVTLPCKALLQRRGMGGGGGARRPTLCMSFFFRRLLNNCSKSHLKSCLFHDHGSVVLVLFPAYGPLLDMYAVLDIVYSTLCLPGRHKQLCVSDTSHSSSRATSNTLTKPSAHRRILVLIIPNRVKANHLLKRSLNVIIANQYRPFVLSSQE